jgi:hypothetical protein
MVNLLQKITDESKNGTKARPYIKNRNTMSIKKWFQVENVLT